MHTRTFRPYVLFLLCAVALLPGIAVATQPIPPVATKISGSVSVLTSDGAHHEVIASKILHSGDVVSTGPNSLAQVELADVGRVIVGPSTATSARTAGASLSLQISSGLLCLQSSLPALSVKAGALSVTATDAPTVFDLVRTPAGTKIAVYRGAVGIMVNGTAASMLHAGEAAISTNDGKPQQTALSAITSDFAPLHCPDSELVAQALALPVPAPSLDPTAAQHGGGGGSVIGWLLGLAAIGAAAGHGGGGGNAAAPAPLASQSPRPTPTPTVTPTPVPSPTPTPSPSPTPTPSSTGTMSVDPGSLHFGSPGDNSQSFDASDPASRSYSATTLDSSVATVTLQKERGHRATFSVSPAGNGATTIHVTDDAGGQADVGVSVGGDRAAWTMRPTVVPPAPQVMPHMPETGALGVHGAATLAVGATSLIFAETLGSQSLPVSEAGYSGALCARSSDDAVAVVTPQVAIGPARIFVVTARAPGVATIIISDERGNVHVTRVVVLRPRLVGR